MTPDVIAYTKHRSRPVAEAMIANVMRHGGTVPYALDHRPVTRRGTVVCVGAGPSLDRTGPELARLQKAGARIFTVNTALPAVARWCVPDVVMVREIVDVSSHLAHPAGLRVLDVGASPRVWDAAIAHGPCAWFFPGAPQYYSAARALGLRPLFGGPAALTGAVALAEAWGALEVVLVGCDLALGDDGSSYASGSAFEGQRATIGDDGVAMNHGPGYVTKLRQHEAAGVEAYPFREATSEVERYGGGTLRTTTQWLSQLEWLANFAKRHPEIGCVDATGSGARKAGWLELPPEARATGSLTVRLPAPDASIPDRFRAIVLEECDRAMATAVNVLHPDGNPHHVPGFASGTAVVDALAAAWLLEIGEGEEDVAAKVRAAYGEAFPDAVRVALDGVSAFAESNGFRDVPQTNPAG